MNFDDYTLPLFEWDVTVSLLDHALLSILAIIMLNRLF